MVKDWYEFKGMSKIWAFCLDLHILLSLSHTLQLLLYLQD